MRCKQEDHELDASLGYTVGKRMWIPGIKKKQMFTSCWQSQDSGFTIGAWEKHLLLGRYFNLLRDSNPFVSSPSLHYEDLNCSKIQNKINYKNNKKILKLSEMAKCSTVCVEKPSGKSDWSPHTQTGTRRAVVIFAWLLKCTTTCF